MSGSVKIEFLNPSPADTDAMSVGTVTYTIANGAIETGAKLAAPAKYSITIFNDGVFVRNFKCSLAEGDGTAVTIQTLYINAVTAVNVTPPPIYEGGAIEDLTGTGSTGDVLTLQADGTVAFETGGAGTGDMSKVVYDTDLDGKVDAAETADAAPWTGITGKPSTFAPSSHTHPISEVTSLQTTLDGKASTSHTHAIADTTGLQTALDGKASSSHTHAIADTTGLQTALDGKASSSHTHTVTQVTDAGTAATKNTPASGDAAAGEVVLGNDTRLSDSRTPTTHSHTIADTTGLQTALDGKAASSHTHTASQITDAGTAATKNTPATGDAASGEVVLGNDTRLTDARTPTTHTHDDRYYTETETDTLLSGKAASSHTHTLSQVTDAGTSAALNVPASGDAAAGEVVKGNDTRLSDARTPTTHTHDDRYYTETETDTLLSGKAASSHTHAASDITSGTMATARLGSGSASSTTYLRGDQTWASEPVTIVIAASDESTAITTGTAKVTYRMPFAMTVTAVRASVSTASSSGVVTIDINETGTSILSTKLTIDASEKTSTTAATAAVISDSALADDAEITIDFDTAGTGAKGVKVYIIGTR